MPHFKSIASTVYFNVKIDRKQYCGWQEKVRFFLFMFFVQQVKKLHQRRLVCLRIEWLTNWKYEGSPCFLRVFEQKAYFSINTVLFSFGSPSLCNYIEPSLNLETDFLSHALHTSPPLCLCLSVCLSLFLSLSLSLSLSLLFLSLSK